MSLSSKKSVTLLELLISVALLGLIVLGIANLQLFSRYQVTSSDRRAKLQHNASYVLEHMAKEIGQAIGDLNNPAIVAYADNRGIRIKIDSNRDGRRDDDTVDLWIAYRHENIPPLPATPTDSEIRFYRNAGDTETPSGSPETLARKIVISDPPSVYGLEFSVNFNEDNELIDNVIEVKIITRWDPDPSQPVSPDNPEVTMLNSIKMPSVSTN